MAPVNLPLIVIVGPTASGKTAVAIELAEELGGEIICADSRTIYEGMDIGTAKPTSEDLARVPHWGVDLVKPTEQFSAADFKVYATAKMAEIRGRGRIPLLVGGTGLYVDAVLFDYQFGNKADAQLREKLQALSIEELHGYCKKYNVTLPENQSNKRYVIRAIEQKSINNKRRQAPLENSIVVGIATDRIILHERIRLRAEQIFDKNVVEEAIILGKKYGWNNEAMTGNIYPLLRSYLEKKITLDEVKEKFTTADWRLAKRQLTWFRRNPYIKWLDLSEVRQYVLSILVNEQVS